MNSIEIIATLEKVEEVLPPGTFKDFLNDFLNNDLGVKNTDMSDLLTKFEKENINDEAILIGFIGHLLIKSTEIVIKDSLLKLARQI